MQDQIASKDLTGRQIIIFCDFDGTITKDDVTDTLLEKLADPQWTEIEERWLKGEIDDCQCMAQQIALIRGDWQDIINVINKITIDQYFKTFVFLCTKMNIPIYIGSSGLDRIIKYILDREKVKISGYWSYQLIKSAKNWSLEFPLNKNRMKCLMPDSVACKCACLEKEFSEEEGNYINPYRIVIGDSRSDFCWANKADFVFAKSKLIQYCCEKNIDHFSFSDFSEINEYIKQGQLTMQAVLK